MWYNPANLLSHSCLFNFVISSRGVGKTYSFARWSVSDFLNNGNQFIYLRRYKTELADIKSFFSKVALEFPEHTFEVRGKTFLIDGQTAGYAIALSTGLTKKSVNYEKVNKIIYDEFVIDQGHIRYLKNEVVTFLEMYETVARLRYDIENDKDVPISEDVRAFFLSNAVSVSNPYFTYWNIKPHGGRFTKVKNGMIVEMFLGKDYIETKKKTRFGKIINGTNYGDYAIENNYLKDNNNFCEKRTQKSRFEFSIVYAGINYGIWFDNYLGLFHVSNDVDPSSTHQYVIMGEDHKPNMFLLNNLNSNYYLKLLKKGYEQGFVRFKDMQVKNQALEIFKTLNMVR